MRAWCKRNAWELGNTVTVVPDGFYHALEDYKQLWHEYRKCRARRVPAVSSTTIPNGCQRRAMRGMIEMSEHTLF